MLGLQNYGNNCYFNASVQALTSSKYIINFLLNADDDKLTREELFLKHICRRKWCEEGYDVESILKLHHLVIKKTGLFPVGHQEDAHELLTILLDNIGIKNKNESIVDIVSNKYEYARVCKKCKNNYYKKDNINVVSLSCHGDTLSQNIRDYIAFEELEYPCDNCDNKDFYRKIMLATYEFPETMIFHLKRFKYHNNSMMKIVKPIDIEMAISLQGNVYMLRSLVIHEGSYGGGHYYTLTKIKNDWYIYNDRQCKKYENFNIDIFKKNIYLVVYDIVKTSTD